MGNKLNLNDIASTQASSFITVINNNNSAIETAMEKTLSRDGSSPNQMEAALDMNSNRIMNLPLPLSGSEPVRKSEFDAEMEGLDAATESAALSATAALGFLDEFSDIYLGVKTSDPAVDNDGDALQDGALYYNSVEGLFKVFSTTNNSWGSGVRQSTANAISTRDYTGTDTAILAAATADAISSGVYTVFIHYKGSNWSITSEVLDGRVAYIGDTRRVVLSVDASIPHLVRQTSSQRGGGLFNLDVNLNGNWTTYGIRIGGKDFSVVDCVVDGGTTTASTILFEIEGTSENALISGGKQLNASTIIRTRSTAKNCRVINSLGIEGYLAKGVLYRMETGTEQSFYFINNRVGSPVSADPSISANSKQPFAVNAGAETTTTSKIFVLNNFFDLPGGPHKNGVANTATADAISFQGATQVFCFSNRVIGSGEVGINFSEGANGVCAYNYVEGADVVGINFGTSASPSVTGAVVMDNIVKNCGLDAGASVASALGNFGFTNQVNAVFANNVSIITNGITEADVTFKDCTNLLDIGLVSNSGWVTASRILSGTNTFHTKSVQDLAASLASIDAELDGKAALSHTHTTSDITGLGTLATQSGTFSGTSSGTNTGDQNVFSRVAVSGQSDVVADTTSDTLTLVAGTNVTITTDASTDAVTISATGGGGGVSDGDKGDVIVSGSGATWTLDIAGASTTEPDILDEVLFADVSNSDANRQNTLEALFRAMRRKLQNYTYYLFNDFESEITTTSTPLFETNSGTGAATTVQAASATNRVGVVRSSTGTTATGRAAVSTSASSFTTGGGELIFEAAVNVTTLSTGTERFQLVVGLFDTLTAANQVDAIAFVYDEGGVSTGSTASANWQSVTASNSTRTWNAGASGSDTVSAGTWARLKIVVNAAGTQADFYVNDVLRYSHTTNIPTGTARAFGVGWLLIKSIGTTARTLDVDYVLVDQDFTTPR